MSRVIVTFDHMSDARHRYSWTRINVVRVNINHSLRVSEYVSNANGDPYLSKWICILLCKEHIPSPLKLSRRLISGDVDLLYLEKPCECLHYYYRKLIHISHFPFP